MQYLLAKMLVATERLIHLPAIPHRMECPQENTMTESIPSFDCSPHGGDDSDRHEELLSHLQLSSIERRDNATLPLPAADTLYNDIDHNPNPNPRSSLLVKEALLSRWILLLGIFGIHSTTVSDDDDKFFMNLEDMKEIIGHEIVHIPLVKSEVQSHLRCDLKLMSASDPYSAAVGMVNTAFKERGPLTASEGAALRDFFRKEAKS